MAKKILLVEDDPTIIQMYTIKFKEKYEVVQTGDGASALELAKKEQTDIILLDIIIPQLDGFEVLTRLKADSALKNIPVILLTNLAQDSDKEKGEKLGAKAYMVKAEYTPTQVLTKIEEYLK